MATKHEKKAAKIQKKPVAKRPAPAAEVAKDVDAFKTMLLKLRDRATGHISFLSDDTLNRMDDTPTEDRTDDFDREFALNLVSSEHDVVFENDEALRKIAEGSYGASESCGSTVERARLSALPFAKLCVKCQSQAEKGRTKFRPFGGTLYQNVERTSEPAPAEAEEAE